MTEVDVFWIMTPCSDVVGYQRFGGPSCLHLYHIATRRYDQGHQHLVFPRYFWSEGKGAVNAVLLLALSRITFCKNHLQDTFLMAEQQTLKKSAKECSTFTAVRLRVLLSWGQWLGGLVATGGVHNTASPFATTVSSLWTWFSTRVCLLHWHQRCAECRAMVHSLKFRSWWRHHGRGNSLNSHPMRCCYGWDILVHYSHIM